ncbi:MAG: bifunctional glycosyltransferase family 2/GtrA family protein [Bryobacteraceae bacterium]
MAERLLETPAALLALERAIRAARPVLLIPAYRPGGELVEVVKELHRSSDLGGILVLDDGSGPGYREIFGSLRAMDRVQVVSHVVNLGKGAALKTGMNHAACQFPDSAGIVTADADGQHSAADILKVALALSATPAELIVGSRGFDKKVPFRSRFGNILTRYVMRTVTGQKLGDTQSGLRGIPLRFVSSLLKLRATGYDFELDMLVTCKETGRYIREVPISTIYIDNNRSSHFNPLLDSMRIYFVFVRFLAVSLCTAAIDNAVFMVALGFSTNLLLCQIAGRIVAGMFQFTAGKEGVFHSKARVTPALLKYWALVGFSGAISYLLMRVLLHYTTLGVVPAKLIAESLLFLLSFIIQRDFVFAPEETAV